VVAAPGPSRPATRLLAMLPVLEARGRAMRPGYKLPPLMLTAAEATAVVWA
jgi:predicted DNA-binding transcriptional regulator YafY